jgi:hypothetical protein
MQDLAPSTVIKLISWDIWNAQSIRPDHNTQTVQADCRISTLCAKRYADQTKGALVRVMHLESEAGFRNREDRVRPENS